MSQIDINGLLSQIHDLRARIDPGVLDGPTRAQPGAGHDAVVNFGTLLKHSISDVAGSQNHARQMSAAFERGDPSANLAQVMLAVNKANLSFSGLTQVRNKVVEAYRSIMNMAI